jgi:hypothetical protein
MAKKKTVTQMSSDELFELAKARQAEEAELQRESERQKLEELREERRTIVARHRKELSAIDSKIRKLRGKGSSGRGRSGVNISNAVLEILANKNELNTKEIQAELAAAGIVANNLSQTLAYLKRQNKITSPARSVYAIA